LNGATKDARFEHDAKQNEACEYTFAILILMAFRKSRKPRI